MPGMIGGMGCDFSEYEILISKFRTIWRDTDLYLTENGFLCAHSFEDSKAIQKTQDGLHFAVDGEASLYRNASMSKKDGSKALFELSGESVELTECCKGNVAICDFGNQYFMLATDWSGIFPLYYCPTRKGLLFSSLMRPLAKFAELSIDPFGVLQFMRYAHNIGDRTHFKGLKRMLPGQVLIYKANRNELRIYETSKVWTKWIKNERLDILIEVVWNTLQNAVRRCNIPGQKQALMNSAGWDSRLLLAAMSEEIGRSSLIGYSHGDIESKELEIARRISQDQGINLHLEPIGNDVIEIEALQKGFERIENAVFPYWHKAGRVLSELGAKSVYAGIFGEVVGGHYNKSMFLSGWRQKVFVAGKIVQNYFPIEHRKETPDIEAALAFMRPERMNKPWYLKAEYWDEIPEITEAFNGDIEAMLKRYVNRGVNDANQICEAFLTENRGAQMVASQLLSCRAYLDVANVYGDRELLELSSQIPLQLKICNSIDRAVLLRYAPHYLKYSTSAILTTARAPILVQEASRAIRKSLEDKKRMIKGMHPGWDNFEFLKDGKILQMLLDEMRNEMIDKNSMQKYIMKVKRGEVKIPLFDAGQLFFTIYSTDLMIR